MVNCSGFGLNNRVPKVVSEFWKLRNLSVVARTLDKHGSSLKAETSGTAVVSLDQALVNHHHHEQNHCFLIARSPSVPAEFALDEGLPYRDGREKKTETAHWFVLHQERFSCSRPKTHSQIDYSKEAFALQF